jgi:hypothetical protein
MLFRMSCGIILNVAVKQNHLFFAFLVHFCFGLRRWVDNIKMDLREIGWDGIDWIDLAEGRD